jgi:putative heme-binding domain-containing protein
VERADDSLRASAARAAAVWKVESLRPALELLARGSAAPASVRRAAIDGLAMFGGSKSIDVLESLSAPDQEPSTRIAAAAALAELDLKRAAARAADVLTSELKGADLAPLFAAFLQRRGGPKALAAALGGRSVPADTAKIGLRLARSAPRSEPALVEALFRAGGLASGPRAVSASEREQVLNDVARVGDPERGEAVFRRTDLACLKCHSIAGAGGQVGPDLVSIGASAPVDYLLDSILDPQKAVKENYHALAVATDDGRILTGIKLRQTESELVLRDSDDREVTVPLRSVEEQKPAGSLMPAGLADSLTRAELVDVVRFLSELGKVGSAFSVSRARFARRWELAEPAPEAGRNLPVGPKELALGSDPRVHWRTVYSQVSGLLPLSDLAPILESGNGSNLAFARCQVEVTTPGPVRLLLNSVDGLELWLDGTPVESKDVVTRDLSPGTHTLTFAIDLATRTNGLRCELGDAPGSPARARMVGGK